MRSARRTRAVEVATVLLFVAALLAPALDLLLRPDEARSVRRENREPAARPAAVTSLAGLARFPTAFESWFSDRLGLRDVLLRASQAERSLVCGLDPSPTIIRGRDGFDFFAGDFSESVHRGIRPATERELQTWTKALEAQRDRCRRLGAEFVFVIVPDKQTIYPEKWPAERAVLGPTRLAQLAAWLAAKSDVRFVDLREPLRRERAHDRVDEGDFLYHPLGSHVTWRGGHAAWTAIVEALADVVPAPARVDAANFVRRELPEAHNDSMWDQTYVGDRVHQRGWALDHAHGPAPVLEYGPKNEIVSSRLADPRLPTALFVHDSFGPWILPYAVHSFARLDAVWTHRVPRELIERHRPRIVIQELTERALTWGFDEVAPDVEHVTDVQFQAYAPFFGPIDVARDALFGTSGSVSIARAASGWEIEQRAGDGVIALPDAQLPEGADLAVRLRIVAPAAGNVLVFYQTKAEPRFARTRALALNLEQGTNRLCFRALAPHLWGGLCIRLGATGTYTLEDFEMRAAR
jgi:hypothetical protein